MGRLDRLPADEADELRMVLEEPEAGHQHRSTWGHPPRPQDRLLDQVKKSVKRA